MSLPLIGERKILGELGDNQTGILNINHPKDLET
jgi:hypothetical protein